MFNTVEEVCEKYDFVLEERDLEYTDTFLNIFNSDELNESNYDMENASVLYYFGLYYMYKHLDGEKLIKYFNMSIDKGHIDSIMFLACYYKSIEDTENMIKMYNMASVKGVNLAMECLGSHYYNAGDEQNMIKYVLMAIESGNARCMEFLGVHYMKKKDVDNAKKYLLMAIEKDLTSAMHIMGMVCQAIGDEDDMIKYLSLAAERGLIQSKYLLGKYLIESVAREKEINVKLSLGKALEISNVDESDSDSDDSEMDIDMMAKLAEAEGGDDAAMVFIADYYHKKNNLEKMAKYLLMAIEMGNYTAMNNIGFYYWRIGEAESAKKYFTMAVEHGCLPALNNLAMYYYQTGDIENAEKYYKIGIERDDESSMHSFGMYCLKQGDIENMNKYLIMAAKKGLQYSMDELIEYYKSTPIKLYNILASIDHPTIRKMAEVFEMTPEVKRYVEKLRNLKLYPLEGECAVCNESKSLIDVDADCEHKICTDCYASTVGCYRQCGKEESPALIIE